MKRKPVPHARGKKLMRLMVRSLERKFYPDGAVPVRKTR